MIVPECNPRHGWKEAFQAAGAAMEDELLLEDSRPSEFDRKEWMFTRKTDFCVKSCNATTRTRRNL
jgi:hypothetical protein